MNAILRLPHAALFALLSVSLCAGCARHRPVKSETELLTRRAEISKEKTAIQFQMVSKLVPHIRAQWDEAKANGSTEPPTLDALVISGGGDFGAFGAGFLKGWDSVGAGGIARPEFEVVLGVSTGALIAPFAYLGQDSDYEQVLHFYTNPKPDWVRDRGLLFFLPSNESFAEVPGLERELRSAFGPEQIARLARESEKGRLLAVNTTDLDDGSARAFEISHLAVAAEKTGDSTVLLNTMLASAGIPGAFPPREIAGGLYVDGGVTGNILYGGAVKQGQGLPFAWSMLQRGAPKLRVRYWVILNNWFKTPPKTTQPNWFDVVARSVDVAIRASTVTSLRHLFAMAEIGSLKGFADIEVRVVAIPDLWRPPVEGIFEEVTMRDLAKVGEEMGKDPNVWMREVPD